MKPIYLSILVSMVSWCCMRLDLLLGCARGFPGTPGISPVWLDRCNALFLFLFLSLQCSDAIVAVDYRKRGKEPITRLNVEEVISQITS